MVLAQDGFLEGAPVWPKRDGGMRGRGQSREERLEEDRGQNLWWPQLWRGGFVVAGCGGALCQALVTDWAEGLKPHSSQGSEGS